MAVRSLRGKTCYADCYLFPHRLGGGACLFSGPGVMKNFWVNHTVQ